MLLKIKEKGNIYAINESNKHIYNPDINNYIDDLIDNKYTGRWVASLVADFHRTIIKGGIVMYPSNKKNPDGRIRLLYEAYPLANIIEKVGGSSYDEISSILDQDFPSDNPHKRTPIYFGSNYEMDKLKTMVKF